MRGYAFPRGYFLSMEGPDGSGKTSQVQLLEDRLLRFGFDVYRTREPGGCGIAEKIRQLLLDPANGEMTDVTGAVRGVPGAACAAGDPPGAGGGQAGAVRPVCGLLRGLPGGRTETGRRAG